MATAEQAPANERLHIGKPLERQPHSAAENGTKNNWCAVLLGMVCRTGTLKEVVGSEECDNTTELRLGVSLYAMPPTTSIPRFLLPQRGAIWRTRLSIPTSTSLTIRSASNKKKNSTSKPPVLEKPSKFVPPSHPARLRKEGPRYPGPPLSDEEIARQTKKKYPNMMPPEGSFMHWFMMNKTIHMWITLGTLFTLAGTVWITNFKHRSPFADMLPSWTQLFIHPIACTRTFLEVLRLDSERTTAETMERRKRKVEDVQKRAAYRKAHGMETDESFGGWTAKSDGQLLGPGMPIGDVEGEQTEQARPKKPLKKWLGIW